MKPRAVQQLAVLQGAVDHGVDAILLGILLPLGRIDRTAVHAHADGAVVLAGHVDEELHLVLPRLAPLVMVQVARVVADLVDHRRDVGRQAIVLLEIAGEIGLGPLADLGQGQGVGLGIDRHANDVGPGLDQVLDLGDRRVHVGRLRGAHALNGDRIAGADREGANLDGTGGIAGGLRHRACLSGCGLLISTLLFYAISPRSVSREPTNVAHSCRVGPASRCGLQGPRKVRPTDVRPVLARFKLEKRCRLCR